MRLMYVTRRPAGYRPAQQYDSRMRAGGPAGPPQACLARGWRFR